MFVDHAKIHVKAGDGGNGCLAFRREKFRPRGGPSGGDGGNGGSIYLHSTTQLNTLVGFRYKQHLKAGRGGHGSGNDRHAKEGKSLIVQVPVGTQVYNEDGELLFDLAHHDQTELTASGGKGGRGNASYKTATNQAPRKCEKGYPGEEGILVLELKILADVGLIGYPNAGKSTLISVLSSAHPKIADYPFTTLSPNLGVVEYGGFSSFVVADIPGLVEGAHQGTGLGHQFLRHVERTRVLVHLVDISDSGQEDPIRAVEVLLKELELYNPVLSEKPQIIAASKLDSANPELLKILHRYCQKNSLPFQEVSAVTGEGLDQLKHAIIQALQENCT